MALIPVESSFMAPEFHAAHVVRVEDPHVSLSPKAHRDYIFTNILYFREDCFGSQSPSLAVSLLPAIALEDVLV